jgi:hypothetical protein
LLTHPRNLDEPDVLAAARLLPRGGRLFAVSVDAEGEVRLSELRHGEPTTLRRARVNFAAAHEPPPAEPAPDVAAPGVWMGAVETIPFPFRFGLTGRVQSLAFDRSGRRLAVLGPHGMIHVVHLDTGRSEILPRGYLWGFDSERLFQAEHLLGVAGGFVAAGVADGLAYAVHYDLDTRVARAHMLGPRPRDALLEWYALPELHCVVAYTIAEPDPKLFGVDLTTGGRHPVGGAHELVARAMQACDEVRRGGQPPAPRIRVVRGDQPARGRRVEYDADRGALRLFDQAPPGQVPRSGTPLADGQPVLKGAHVSLAQLAGPTLALCCIDRNGAIALRLFDPATLTPSVEYPVSARNWKFLLSPDGRLLARQADVSEVTVVETGNPSQAVAALAGGRYHPNPRVRLAGDWLSIGVGNRDLLLIWRHGPLQVGLADMEAKVLDKDGTLARVGAHPLVGYDRQRFVAAAEKGPRTAVVDCYGQVSVFDARKRKLIVMFFAWRGQFAAWMPDGTRHGPSELISGPPTPGALARIADALRAAGSGE